MDDNLLQDEFADNIDKTVINKALTVIKVILILFICYSIIDLLQWYTVLQTNVTAQKNSPDTNFYIGGAIVSVFIILVNLAGWIFFLNGTRLIYTSFEINDPVKFNAGYRQCYRTLLITLVTVAVEIAFYIIKYVYFHQF